MIENTEQFKIVLDLAENKGRRDAENEMLESQNKQLEAANSKLSKQLNQKDKQLTERDIMIKALNQKIKELETIVSSNTCGADGQKQVPSATASSTTSVAPATPPAGTTYLRQNNEKKSAIPFSFSKSFCIFVTTKKS